MCMTDEKYPKITAFSYLEDIQRLFTSKFSEKEINGAIAYNLNEKFKNDLKVEMVLGLFTKEYFNSLVEVENDPIEKLKRRVLSMADDVVDKADLQYLRSEKIQLVISKADVLRSESKPYYSDVINLF